MTEVKLTEVQWHDFCDADPVPEDFIERMEAAGFTNLRKVRRSDIAEDSFAAERGIVLGGYLWELTKRGHKILEATPTPGPLK